MKLQMEIVLKKNKIQGDKIHVFRQERKFLLNQY